MALRIVAGVASTAAAIRDTVPRFCTCKPFTAPGQSSNDSGLRVRLQ